MKAVVLALLAVSALAFTEQEYQDNFVGWMKKFDKSYDAKEFFYRYGVFKGTMDWISTNTLNKNVTWATMNQFADLSSEEFGRIYASGYIPAGNPPIPHDPSWVATTGLLDWTVAGSAYAGSPVAVTPVKNQQQCGSCWAFSTTGSVEGWVAAIKKAGLISLSEQQLVSCSTSYGNLGCNGGMYTNAGNYIAAHGDTTEAAYPYTSGGGTTGPCLCGTTDACTPSTDTTQLNAITMAAPTTGANFIASHIVQQPVSVAVQANQAVFQNYGPGQYPNNIMCAAACGTSLDHAILVVGYDTVGGQAYWKVKNSWGTTWGEAGYIYMCQSSGNGECGINMEPAYAH